MNYHVKSTTDWPQKASIAEWSRVVGVSAHTLSKKFKAGLLRGEKQLSNVVLITKEDICDCFNIRDQADLATTDK